MTFRLQLDVFATRFGGVAPVRAVMGEGEMAGCPACPAFFAERTRIVAAASMGGLWGLPRASARAI